MNIRIYRFSRLSIMVSVALLVSGSACSQSHLDEMTQQPDVLVMVTQTPQPEDQAVKITEPTVAGEDSKPQKIGSASLMSNDIPVITELKQDQTSSQDHAISIEKKADSSLLDYSSQSGDTLYAIASHFNVPADQIKAIQPGTNLNGYIETGTQLQIPKRLDTFGPSELILPDSEVVYAMTACDFDIQSFINQAEGYLHEYRETLNDGSKQSYWIIQHVASNNSISPRLLLTLLEYQSNWIYGSTETINPTDYPMNWIDLSRQGLNLQMNWAADQLNAGYYSWRDGTLTELTFPDGSSLRLAPTLNAGTVAVQYLMSKLYLQDEWYDALYGPDGIKEMHELLFGDPWERASTIEPLIPAGLTQPELQLPFQEGHGWNLTGGPHPAWGSGSPWAALDFAPTGVHGCEFSDEWVTSVAPGLVVRTESGLVMVDLDGDGYEQSGWNILYMHIYEQESVEEGEFVYLNDHIGHPSCSGGSSTGTHVHIARKFNGEWMSADSPVPFLLSGWQAYPGSDPYEGMLFQNGATVNASTCSDASSLLIR